VGGATAGDVTGANTEETKMSKVKNYTVVTAGTAEELQETVNSALAQAMVEY